VLALWGRSTFVRGAAGSDALTVILSGTDHQICRIVTHPQPVLAHQDEPSETSKAPIGRADRRGTAARLDGIDRAVETEGQKGNGKGGSIKRRLKRTSKKFNRER
jgi:hypothetical protein